MKATKKARFDLPYETLRLCRKEELSAEVTGLLVAFARKPLAERVAILSRKAQPGERKLNLEIGWKRRFQNEQARVARA